MRKVKAAPAVLHVESDDRPELVVENDIRLPEPLDHRIGGVWLRTTANNVTEGYDLLLSAAFGQERVVLKGAGYEIGVDFSLTSADIELKPLGCSMAVIEESDRTEDGKTTIQEQMSRETSWGVDAKFSVSGASSGAATAVGRLGTQHETKGMAKSTTSRKVEKLDWGRSGPTTIKVGPTGHMLNGLMISDFKGWRVLPASTKAISAVAAYLKVRENWIKFENMKQIASPPRFGEKLRHFMTTADARQRRCFEILLAHLAQSGLNRHQDGKAATIAVHALVVRPEQAMASSLPTGSNRSEIAIDGAQLDEFLSAENGREVSALIALGVMPEMMSAVSEPEDASLKRARGRFFIPDSNPPGGLEMLQLLVKYGGTMPRSDIRHPRTLRDLRMLKLIKLGPYDKQVELIGKGLDVNLMLRRAVSEMECIKIARAVLVINPHATYVEISKAVALELRKKWPSDSTKRRKGNAILRWMAWLEPHLFDTEISHAASRVAYATSTEAEVGRPAALRRSKEPELRRLVGEGKTREELAKIFNVSIGSIANWMREYGLKKPTKAELAKRKAEEPPRL